MAAFKPDVVDGSVGARLLTSAKRRTALRILYVSFDLFEQKSYSPRFTTAASYQVF
jgi:hypothetical protein